MITFATYKNVCVVKSGFTQKKNKWIRLRLNKNEYVCDLKNVCVVKSGFTQKITNEYVCDLTKMNTFAT